jgi:hypothetical protein
MGEIQLFNPRIKKWVLMDDGTGRVKDYRKEKYENIPVYGEDIQ